MKQKLLNKVMMEPNTGCWLWIGSTNNKYGKINKRLAHRVSYETFVGPLIKDLFVCHKCDTPLCINPHHLFLGTRSENQKDCGRKGRFKTQKDKSFGHKMMVHALHKSRNYQTHLKVIKEKTKIFELLATGLSQRKVAKIVGVNQMLISRLVRNEG